MNLELLLEIPDTFNGLMAIQYLITLLLLSSLVGKIVKEKVDSKEL